MRFGWTLRITAGLALILAVYVAARSTRIMSGSTLSAANPPAPSELTQAGAPAPQAGKLASVRMEQPNAAGSGHPPEPRGLTARQFQAAFNELKSLPPVVVSIATVNSRAEVEAFADDLEALFKHLNWRIKSRVVAPLPSRGSGLGIYVRDRDEHPQAANVLITFLRSQGLSVEPGIAPDLDSNEIRLVVTLR